MTVLNENLLYRVLNFFNSRNIVMTNFCKIKLNLSCQVVGGVSVLSSQNFRCLIYRIGYLGNIEVNSSAVSFIICLISLMIGSSLYIVLFSIPLKIIHKISAPSIRKRTKQEKTPN